MKNLLSLLCALVLILQTSANDLVPLAPNTKCPAFVHLLEVNASWAHWENMLLKSEKTQLVSFANEAERIAFHLNKVSMLLEQSLPELEAPFAAEKLKHIETLKTYAANQTFPINSNHEYRIPYFIDNVGTACAVGHLMLESGAGHIASLVKETMNNAYISEIPQEQYLGWMRAGGFTSQELALIQPGYPPNTTWENHGAGITQGIINDMAYFNGELYVAGDFVYNGYNLKLAHWTGSEFVTINDFVDGTPTKLEVFGDKMYIGFEDALFEPTMAFDGNSFQTLQGLGSKTSSAFDFAEHNGELYVAGQMSGFAGNSPFVAKLVDGSDWEMIGFNVGNLFEQVLALESWNGGLVMGGNFTQYTYNNGEVVPCSHALHWTENGIEDLQLEHKVLDIEKTDVDLWASGNFYDANGDRAAAVARYNGDQTWQTEGVYIDTEQDENYLESNVVQLKWVWNKLLAFGDYSVSTFGSFGNNASIVEQFDDEIYFEPIMGLYDGQVNAGVATEDRLFIGGDFSTTWELGANHMASTANLFDNVVEEELEELVFYPNPTNESLHIGTIDFEPYQVQILDQNGKIVLEQQEKGKALINVDHLAGGLYILQITKARKTQRSRLVLAK